MFKFKQFLFHLESYMAPSWKKNQGDVSTTLQCYSVPTRGKDYLSDPVMFFKIELPGREDVSRE